MVFISIRKLYEKTDIEEEKKEKRKKIFNMIRNGPLLYIYNQ